MGYRDYNSVPLTDGSSIEKGSVGLEHLSPPLFQTVEQIKLHTHTGVDSVQLGPSATPYVLKALGPNNREEHGTTSGTGAVTFGTPFSSAPTVIVGSLSTTLSYATSVTKTGFTMNGAAGSWIAIGS